MQIDDLFVWPAKPTESLSGSMRVGCANEFLAQRRPDDLLAAWFCQRLVAQITCVAGLFGLHETTKLDESSSN